MLAFQVGMFAFWATVATAPRVFLDHRGPGRQARRWIVRFFVPYFVLVYGVGLSVPESLRFPIIIPLIVVGYTIVAGLLFKWVVDLSRNPQPNQGVNAARSGRDMLSVPCDPEAKAVIVDARVDSHRAGPRDRPQVNLRRSHACKHQTVSMRHVSATEAGEGFQVLFARAPDSERGMCLSRGIRVSRRRRVLRRNRGPGVLRPFPDPQRTYPGISSGLRLTENP